MWGPTDRRTTGRAPTPGGGYAGGAGDQAGGGTDMDDGGAAGSGGSPAPPSGPPIAGPPPTGAPTSFDIPQVSQSFSVPASCLRETDSLVGPFGSSYMQAPGLSPSSPDRPPGKQGIGRDRGKGEVMFRVY